MKSCLDGHVSCAWQFLTHAILCNGRKGKEDPNPRSVISKQLNQIEFHSSYPLTVLVGSLPVRGKQFRTHDLHRLPLDCSSAVKVGHSSQSRLASVTQSSKSLLLLRSNGPKKQLLPVINKFICVKEFISMLLLTLKTLL